MAKLLSIRNLSLEMQDMAIKMKVIFHVKTGMSSSGFRMVFQMVGTIVIANDKSPTIWKQNHLKSDLQKVQISNVSYFKWSNFRSSLYMPRSPLTFVTSLRNAPSTNLDEINEMFEGCIQMRFLSQRNNFPEKQNKQDRFTSLKNKNKTSLQPVSRFPYSEGWGAGAKS